MRNVARREVIYLLACTIRANSLVESELVVENVQFVVVLLEQLLESELGVRSSSCPSGWRKDRDWNGRGRREEIDFRHPRDMVAVGLTKG